jgi:integrase
MYQLQSARPVTLRQVWADYQLSRARRLKPSTIADYDRKIHRCFKDWLDIPMRSITKDMIEERHRQISLSGERGTGETLANIAMRVLKALFNYAASKYESEDLQVNPVRRLSEVRAWNREKQRENYITAAQMPAWFKAVLSLRSHTLRDYLILLILTGMRRGEAATLRWSDVNFEENTITMRDTKNRKDHALPLSDYLLRMLTNRRLLVPTKEPFVFPGAVSGSHISLFSKSHSQVIKKSGVQFMLHDLRRTFITNAEALDIQFVTIQKLANHSDASITAKYVVRNVDRLRAPMQAITDSILSQAGLCN